MSAERARAVKAGIPTLRQQAPPRESWIELSPAPTRGALPGAARHGHAELSPLNGSRKCVGNVGNTRHTVASR